MDPTISGLRSDDIWSRHRQEEDALPPAAPAALGRAGSSPAPSEPEATAPGASSPLVPVVPTPARDVQVQRRIDAFYMSLTGWYHTPGRDVAVATPFMMRPGYAAQRAFLADPAKRATTDRAAARAGLSTEALGRVQAGRGTPEEIHRLTQALIDAQPAGRVGSASDVRRLMFDHAIGLDCAGYVQQAYLQALGHTRARAGFASMTRESLSGLFSRGYSRVGALADVRPGDLIVFTHPPDQPHDPGHRAIVYDQRVATADDLRTVFASAEGQTFALGGPLRVLEMDSSYGSGGLFARGGVQRQTWLHNEKTGEWAHEILDGDHVSLVVGSTLYNHPLEGFYRR